ncbi:hypothetical protein TIFTF001_018909 [Ficus carica]|uniref:BHLH domain-containing protein n=1 Tax=Ficus carica TaxID=3494 RepID=A0AA88AEY1_FICCA|nr:hypothetical protein TIFTF001_018909 [Ficus carica]
MDQLIGSAMDELCISEQGRIRNKRRSNMNGPCKNLEAERRRRQKLHDRLMALRGVVPQITNMKKATIVEDAIAHIKTLQQTVDHLKDQLSDVDASSEDSTEPSNGEIHAAEEMKSLGIEPDITVAKIYENKFWIKATFRKKRGAFTKFMEAVTAFGFELTDTSLTTINGAMLVTSCLEGVSCEKLSVDEIKQFLLEIVQGTYLN